MRLQNRVNLRAIDRNESGHRMDRSIGSINRSALRQALDFALSGHDVSGSRALLISPNFDDFRFIERYYPQLDLCITTVRDWDLNDAPRLNIGLFEVAVASNVMHYSNDPERWVSHVLQTSKLFVVQDLVYRKRSKPAPHLGPDGDKTRYAYIAKGVESPSAAPYDLSNIKQPIVYFETFHGGLNEYHSAQDPPVHFAAVFESTEPFRRLTPSLSLRKLFRLKMRNVFYRYRLLNGLYRRASKFLP
jgi:hypothetical protein